MLTADLPDAKVNSDTPSVDALTLKTPAFTLRTLPVEIGELSESMSLASKRRLHHSTDGDELRFEMVNTIPFGAEPEIRRQLRITENLITVTMDLVMRASCSLSRLSAGGWVITGDIRKFGLILPPNRGCLPGVPEMRDFSGTTDGDVLFDAPCPPLGVILESETERFDWMTGDDFWRWTHAERIGGGRSRFVLAREGNALRMQWRLFDKTPVKNGAEELPIPGRNWRLTWAAAWKPLALPRTKKADRSFDLTGFDWNDSARAVFSMKKKTGSERGCGCAAGTLNTLKKWLRSNLDQLQEGDLLEVRNVQPVYCVNAGHVDRAKYGSLPHWDMMSLIEFRRWANRTLSSRNASLRLRAPEKSPWRGFMVLD